MAIWDEIFRAEIARDQAISGTGYSRDGKAVSKGIGPNLDFNRGPNYHPRGPVEENDIIILCGELQKDDKFGHICEDLRSFLGIATQFVECAEAEKTWNNSNRIEKEDTLKELDVESHHLIPYSHREFLDLPVSVRSRLCRTVVPDKR